MGDGGGGVKKCILGAGGVGSVVWWMCCWGVKKVYFRCGLGWECGVVDVVWVGV